MKELTIALISGLKQFGKEKTFNQILTEAGFIVDPIQRIDLAHKLEAKGVIESVIYKLPFEIRAELTERGKKMAESRETDSGLFNSLFTFVLQLVSSPFESVVPIQFYLF